MYKQIKDSIKNEVNQFVILRTTDNTFIPVHPDNTDYQNYLKWVAEGNTPEPAEE